VPLQGVDTVGGGLSSPVSAGGHKARPYTAYKNRKGDGSNLSITAEIYLWLCVASSDFSFNRTVPFYFYFFFDKRNPLMKTFRGRLWPNTASKLAVQILTYLKQYAPFCPAIFSFSLACLCVACL